MTTKTTTVGAQEKDKKRITKMRNSRYVLIAFTCSTIYICTVTNSLYKTDFISSFNNNEWNDNHFDVVDFTTTDDTVLETTTTTSLTVDEVDEQSIEKEEEKNIQCPSGLIPLEDLIVTSSQPLTIVNDDDGEPTGIPPMVHIMVESKCVNEKTKEYIQNNWKSTHNSLIFHDRNDVNNLIQDDGVHKFTNLNQVMKCITSIEHEIDLLKLILLWEKGGIVTDINHVFNKSGKSIIDQHIHQKDEAFFLMKNETQSDDKHIINYEFGIIGAKRHHPISYMLLQKSISHLFQQYADANIYKTSDYDRRQQIMKYPIETFFPDLVHIDNHDDVELVTSTNKKQFKGIYNMTISLFDIGDEAEWIDLVQNQTQSNTNEVINSLQLKPHKDSKSCFNFDPTYATNYQDLKDLTETNTNEYDCASPLQKMPNIYDNHYGTSTQIRRIPNIIHMTSKTRCLTTNYTTNAKTWLFPNHSIIFHDDEAVTNLIQERSWLEFPHIQDASVCITSGAGMADLWRYLALWEYGGIYTDADNSPGPKFVNGSLILDDTDAFLEVEAGNFPSQYFIAVAPHHPLMYFAVNVAIQRLFEENNIVQQYVPYITGPGALKSAMIHTIANGNPQNGTHVGVNQRNVTMVGNRKSARKVEYIHRGSVSNHEYSKMNMTHYSIAGRQKHLPRKPCLQVLYERS